MNIFFAAAAFWFVILTPFGAPVVPLKQRRIHKIWPFGVVPGIWEKEDIVRLRRIMYHRIVVSVLDEYITQRIDSHMCLLSRDFFATVDDHDCLNMFQNCEGICWEYAYEKANA